MISEPSHANAAQERFNEALAPFVRNILRYGEVYPGAIFDLMQLQQADDLHPVQCP